MARLRLVISGRVQGVGFRASAAGKAAKMGLRGWVCNRPDGSVETEFEGPAEAVEALRTWCAQGPPLARVTNVECVALSQETFMGFEIR